MAEEKAGGDKSQVPDAASNTPVADVNELAAEARHLEDENARLRSHIRELELERERNRGGRQQGAAKDAGELSRQTRELAKENENLRSRLRSLEDELNLKPSLPLHRPGDVRRGSPDRGGQGASGSSRGQNVQRGREGASGSSAGRYGSSGNASGDASGQGELMARGSALCRCLFGGT
jgi:hypothetical protein